MEVPFDAKALGAWARQRNLRLLAHSRRIVFVMLPLGAFTGWMMGLAVKAYSAGFRWVDAHLVQDHLVLLLPLAGLPLATMMLDFSGVGEVSLSEDIHLSRENPFQAFPFRKSLVKVAACFATIFLGGSAGLEGPAKWFGGSVGLQCHRLLSWLAKPFRFLRRLKTEAGTMVVGGAAGAISSVFRAPLSAALYAAEHEGALQTRTLIPTLVAAAGGYLVFAAMVGHEPLLALPRPYFLRWREIWLALPLGVACGLVSSLFNGAIAVFRRRLAWIPLRWRGFAGGLGLALLMVPGHLIMPSLPTVRGGGVELVNHLIQTPADLRMALIFLGIKLIGTALTLGSGGIGGTWLPAVCMGACLGSAFDAAWLPGYPGLLTMLGATALAGAFNGTILVPVVFLAETTAQAPLVVPALVATTVAYLVARDWA
ncbi:MAG TPA: chloride channel protein [Holophagaceae bacterium]|nr:chloride channel protein [Holophagaceae bacterium]